MKPSDNLDEENFTWATRGPQGQNGATMSYVFVLDQNKVPLNPVHPGRARMLLTEGRAAMFRRYPFTIILKQRVLDAMVVPLRLKIDPGSKTTGLAVINDATGQVVWAAELTHRGERVKANLDDRRQQRHGRRTRHTRYRAPRFENRTRPKGWLPPSLLSRVNNVLTWVARLQRYAPIKTLSQELVRFNTQLMQDAEIRGVQYQQGILQGYEVREYLLEKWCRQCVYCGIQGVPLQVEHIVPRARGGTDRVSNLTLACEPCNTRKGTQSAEEFGYPDVQKLAQQPLKDAAAVNTTRWALYHRLMATGQSVEVGTGGRTKWNRTTRQLPKTHWIDASCVGASTPDQLNLDQVVPLFISATGRQRRQMCLMDQFGFPRTKGKGSSLVHGFRTGDIVHAKVPVGKHAGSYLGKVAVRAKGSFNISTHVGTVTDISYRYCHRVHAADGYSYQKGVSALTPCGTMARVSASQF